MLKTERSIWGGGSTYYSNVYRPICVSQKNFTITSFELLNGYKVFLDQLRMGVHLGTAPFMLWAGPGIRCYFVFGEGSKGRWFSLRIF